MIRPTAVEVKGVVRPAPAPPRQIQFPFRADPVALDDLGLDSTARSTFVLILDNARTRGGRSRLSNGTMGRILGRCPMTISRALGRLEAAGLIRRDLAAGGRIRTGIVITWEAVQGGRLTVQTELRRGRLTGSAPAPQGLGARAELIRSPIQSENQTGPILPSQEGEDSEAAALFATLGPAAFLRAMIAKGKAEAAGKPAPPPVPSGPVRAPQDDQTPPALPNSAPIADRPATAKPAASTATIPNAAQQSSGATLYAPCINAVSTPGESSETANFPPGKVGANPGPDSGFRRTVRPCYNVSHPSGVVPSSDVMATVRRMVGGLAEGLKAEDLGRRRVGPKRLAAQLAEVRRRHGRHV